MPKPRKPVNSRSRSNTGRPDISTTIWSSESSSGQCRTIPLKVCRAAMAAAICPCGSNFRVCAISVQVRSSTADVFGPRSSGNSWVARLNRPSASVCHTKRKGSRGGCVSDDGESVVLGAMLVASESDRRRFRRFCENGAQCECRSRAELEHTDLPDRNLAFRGSVVTRFAGEPLCIECDQVSSVTKERLRQWWCVDQFPVGGKYGRGAAEVGALSRNISTYHPTPRRNRAGVRAVVYRPQEASRRGAR